MIGDEDDRDLVLDTRLAEELRQQLDSQLGRAARYFAQRRTAPNARRPSHWRRRRRLYVSLLAAAAACCAVLLVWNRFQPDEIPRLAADAKAVGEPPTVEPNDVARIEKPSDAEHSPHLSPANQEKGRAANASPSESLILASALSTRTVDDGVRLVGRTPMRKIRRQWFERVEWFDPLNGARVQRIVPHEEVLFVPLPIN